MIKKLASITDLEDAVELIGRIESALDNKANEIHTHTEYVNINNSLTVEDIDDIFAVLKGIKTIEEVLAEAKKR